MNDIFELLPERCLTLHPTTEEVIIIKRGMSGYYKYPIEVNTDKRVFVDGYNRSLGVKKNEEAAMLCGSLFGWHLPASDPRSYDEKGEPIPPKKNRER